MQFAYKLFLPILGKKKIAKKLPAGRREIMKIARGQFSKFPDFPRAIFWGEFPIVSVISYKFWPISYNQIGKTTKYLIKSQLVSLKYLWVKWGAKF